MQPPSLPSSAGRTLLLALAVLYLLAVAMSFLLMHKRFLEFGILSLVVTVCTAPIAFLLASRRAEPAHAPRSDMPQRLDEIADAIKDLREHAALSDDARRILARHADREVLKHAIEEDIVRGDHDGAMVLIAELGEQHGQRASAEGFRQRIDRSRSSDYDAEVIAAVADLDALVVQRRWDLALADAARVTRLYPDSPRVHQLRERVESARSAYKDELERRFLVAAREESPQQALSLLKQLDEFLTEQEAEPYRELARGVIGKARDNLGAEFKLAVQDRHWPHAAALGQRIIAEFPNSRMAAEIRTVIDNIRAKASAMG